MRGLAAEPPRSGVKGASLPVSNHMGVQRQLWLRLCWCCNLASNVCLRSRVSRMPRPGGIPVYDEDWQQVCWDKRLSGAAPSGRAGAGTRAAVDGTV